MNPLGYLESPSGYESIMLESIGTLHYTHHIRYRLVLLVDQGISDYYYSLIPKCKYAKRPMHAAHVTIVRPGKEIPPNLQFWDKYEGEKVPFLYDPSIKWGESQIYYWLNVLCVRLEEIRIELGLPVDPVVVPPEGYRRYFHMTLGNTKQ
jgi:hypothetical protein